MVCDYYRIPERAICQTKKGRGAKNRSRNWAMYLAQQSGGCSSIEITEVFGLKNYGGMSNVLYEARQKVKNVGSVRKEINTIINRFDPLFLPPLSQCNSPPARMALS